MGWDLAGILGRHRVALALAGAGTALGLAVGVLASPMLGTVAVIAVLFVAALAVGQNEARRQAAEAKRALRDQAAEVEQQRATAERLRSWVVHRVADEPGEDEVLERGA